MANPENLESPNKSEQKPAPDKNIVKKLGETAIKGSNK